MSAKPNLIVVGGATLQRAESGGWMTKSPIASYLHELGEYFRTCTWFAAIGELPARYEGGLNDNTIDVHVLDSSPGNLVRSWWRLLSSARKNTAVLLYLPAALLFIPILPLLRRRAGAIAVYLAGDYLLTIEEKRSEYGAFWARYHRIGFETVLRSAHLVIARGAHLAGIARRVNKEVVETMPLGHPVVAAGQSTDIRDRILFVGKVTWSKGIRELLHAYAAISEDTDRPDLEIIGDGPELSEAMDMCRALDLQDKVQFRGWIDDAATIDAAFARARFVVVPSIEPEGVPRVIDEAMMRGVPVIASKVGGITNEFDPGQLLLVERGSIGELTAAMRRMLDDAKLVASVTRSMADRSRRWGGAKSPAHQHATLLLGLINNRTKAV